MIHSMNINMNSYFAKKEFKEILNKYEGMVLNHTSIYFDAADLVDVANYYTSIGCIKEAENAINYSLKLHPNDTETLIYKIQSLYYKGMKKEAFQLMEQIEEPHELEVKFLKAELLYGEEQQIEAERTYMELAESENESFEILMDIALCYIDFNNEKYSKKWINRICKKGYNLDNSQEFRDLWCNYCMTFNKQDKAIEAFQKSLDENPYSVLHWNGLCQCYLEQMNIKKANEAIDFSLAIDNKNLESRELKANCYILEDNQEEAICIYKDILNQSPLSNKKRIYEMLGQCYMHCNKHEEALNCYQEWLKEYPHLTNYEKAEIYSYIASCYCNMNQPSKGLQYINETLKFDKYNYGAIIQKAYIHFQLDKKEIANKLLDKALLFCPKDEREDILYNIACCCFYTEQYEQTIIWSKQIIEEYPTSIVKATILMACSYVELNDYENLLLYIVRAIQLCKENYQNDPHSTELLKFYINKTKETYNNIDQNIYLQLTWNQ